MSRRRARIEAKTCRRCGTKTYGLTAPIHGSAAAHARFTGLCDDCCTEAEHREIEADIAAGIMRRAKR